MPKHFDYVIIGAGLAGLQLALHFSRDRFFEQKTFAVIDPLSKTTNDKTWCFWEKEGSEWDSITFKSWNTSEFFSSEKKLKLQLDPYEYKMIRALDFYQYVKSQLKDSPNITFILDEITNIDSAATIANGKKDSYNALHIFDSRISEDYIQDKQSTKILQHFKGWRIETEEPGFDTSAFTMMDFRLKFPASTSFTYVLPLSATEALVEFTFFTPFLTEDNVYDEYLNRYLKEILKINKFKIVETEKGIIPMTDFPFHKDSTSKITKIGTAGSWVKGSSGYSFKHTEKKVKQILKNIKAGKNPESSLLSSKFRWYDSIFLDVLNNRNDLGEFLFTRLYSKNSPQEIFKFLDEETSVSEDLKLMFSLYHSQFLKSFLRKSV